MKRLSHLACGALFQATLAAPALAQTPQLNFERIEGIDHVVAIEQDADGFMWFGGRRGLMRYDGYYIDHYTHDRSDSTSLGFNYVEDLFFDREGTLWIATFGGGLDRFDRASETFTHFRHDPDDPSSLSHNLVTAVLEDRNGNLWVGTHGGLNLLDRETGRFKRFRHDPDDPASLSDDQVRSIYEDRAGTLWIGTYDPHSSHPATTPGGLNRFNPKEQSFTRYLHDPENERSLVSNLVRALYEDSQGRFWVGSWEGALHLMDRESGAFTRFRFDPTRPSWPIEPMPHGDSLEVGITFVHEDAEGIFWIGSVFGGLDRLDPDTGKSTHFKIAAGNWAPTVWTIYESRDGMLWIGTWAGLYKLNPNQTSFHTHDLGGLDTRMLTSLVLDEDRLWIGTYGNGLVHYDLARGVTGHLTHDPENTHSISSDDVCKVIKGQDGVLWVDTRVGLDRYDPASGRFDRLARLPNRQWTLGCISSLYEDREGTLWVGTLGDLSRWRSDRKSFETFRSNVSDSSGFGGPFTDPFGFGGLRISAIHQDASGQLWIGTLDGGLMRYDVKEGRFVAFDRPSGRHRRLSDHAVTHIYEGDDVLWIGTQSGGLNRLVLSTGEVTMFDTPSGHFTRSGINCILGADDGSLWIVTQTKGVTRFDPRDHTFHSYRLPMAAYAYPGTCGMSADGTIFFLAPEGLYAFKDQDFKRNRVAPQVRVTGFVHENDDQARPLLRNLSDPIRLAYDQSSFTVEFVGLHYAAPEDNEYRYRLEGYGSEWKATRNFREASYVNVPPGRYVFRVRAANSNGIWNEEGAALTIVVLPPWWRTGWAYGIYALVLIGGILTVYQEQKRRLIARERQRAALRESELRAEAAQERAATLQHVDEIKSRFFANISHEFRTPLTLILGPVQDAIRTDKAIQGRELDLIRLNARRLLRLINQLLDLARLDSGNMTIQPQRCDVAKILRHITLAFVSRAERESKMLSFGAEPASISGAVDVDKLETIVSNLLSNAFKITSTGGKIAVHVRQVDSAVLITIKDTGSGIPPHEIPRLFDRFYQMEISSPVRRQGSGIGLSLVKELVELQGGAVSVESHVGFGTTFTVRLPLLDAPASDAEADAAIGTSITAIEMLEEKHSVDIASTPSEHAHDEIRPDRDGARRSVLIADDHPDIRAYIRSLLDPEYDVLQACDGEEAFVKVRAERPDLLIADIMMPEMDGIALVQAIRGDTELSDLPIILLTARANTESLVEGFSEGADDYLAKPFDGDELLARIESMIEIRSRLRSKYSGEVLLGPSDIVVSSDDAVFVERVRAIIESRLDDPGFSVEHLADEVALSSRQLQRRLKATTNLSPAGYIRMMRLARAAQLLELQSGQVSEIADRVGYRNADHFSRVFKQVYGVAPSGYADTCS